ncbi:MAG: hypothetical protein HRU20_24140 [Pseudomonadales bacterium]|nr:hypothetical protein [Pseudomonadales bacterium]
MNRFIFKQLSAALLLVGSAGSLQALGLGQMQIESGLGEPLAATLSLIDADHLLEGELIVELANEAAYKVLWVERPYFHENIQFTYRNVNGHSEFILSSDKPLREPFLNVVLALRWPRGEIYKEYTLLIDPPVLQPSKHKISARPSAVAVSSRVVTESQKISTKTRSSKNAPQGINRGERYFSQSGDSLWLIAKKIKAHTSAPVAQIMNAVYSLNTSSFVKADPNRLKAAYSLKIPNFEQISQYANRMPVKNAAQTSKAAVVTPISVVKEAVVLVSPPVPKGDNRLKNENAALRQRVYEMELMAAQLQEKLQKMDETISLLQTQNASLSTPEPISAQNIAVAAAPIIKEKNKPTAPQAFFEGMQKNWSVISGVFFSFLLMGALIIVLSMRRQAKLVLAKQNSGKKPFWEMPVKDLSDTKPKNHEMANYNRPDMNYLNEKSQAETESR